MVGAYRGIEIVSVSCPERSTLPLSEPVYSPNSYIGTPLTITWSMPVFPHTRRLPPAGRSGRNSVAVVPIAAGSNTRTSAQIPFLEHATILKPGQLRLLLGQLVHGLLDRHQPELGDGVLEQSAALGVLIHDVVVRPGVRRRDDAAVVAQAPALAAPSPPDCSRRRAAPRRRPS